MFSSDPYIDLVLRGLILTLIAMIWVVMLVRINGLRSFSKMTNFDFVMTVAMGSLLAGAGQSDQWTSFFQTLVGMVTLFIAQYLTARLRKTSDKIEQLIQNSPVFLMRDGKVLEDALQQTRVARSDLIAKLREANVTSFEQVRAVVLETTGDISVVHGSTCADDILSGVKYSSNL